jgi:alkaline phosphatase D
MVASAIELTRRRLLSGGAALAGLAVAGPLLGERVRAEPRFPGYPFTLGVASGDPGPDGVVLWTRLAPSPLEGGGMEPEAVAVHWRVATDPRLARVVQRGTALARPDLAHSVHVEVRGLEPDRWYWYQFVAGPEASPVGRTRTAPAAGTAVPRLRFAFASCQHWEQGYFSAYRHMLDDELDLVVHLGDYIYESSWGEQIRRHEAPVPTTLEQYRSRHALYKQDPDLQAAHALHPWVLTWDDHEVANDYAGDHSQSRDDPEVFRRRRAAAYQAYYEHLPLRGAALPRGPDLQLYQRVAFGDLAELHVLDNRQYRSAHACGEAGPRGGGRLIAGCATRLDPSRSMLGREQERWLFAGLDGARARWTVIAQQQLMARLRQRTRDGREAYWSDGWDGYAPTRDRILARLRDRRVPNPVVIGGDIHSFWVTDLKADFDDPASPTVATEFVGTSVTSAGPRPETFTPILPDNPHVRFHEGRFRGYVRCQVTPERWLTDLRVVEDVRRPDSAARTLATFVVESGVPGAQRA